MSAHQITTLIIRLAALMWFLYLFDHAGNLLLYFNEGHLEHGSSLMLNVAFTLFQFCCAAALWFYPASTAAKLLPSILIDVPRSAPAPLEWQTMGIICIGLWELARAIPDATYWVTLLIQLHSDGTLYTTPLAPTRISSIAVTAVELVLGVWLLFGATGFAAFLLRVRTAGLTTRNDQEN